jgi:hypothetical protein
MILLQKDEPLKSYAVGRFLGQRAIPAALTLGSRPPARHGASYGRRARGHAADPRLPAYKRVAPVPHHGGRRGRAGCI